MTFCVLPLRALESKTHVYPHRSTSEVLCSLTIPSNYRDPFPAFSQLTMFLYLFELDSNNIAQIVLNTAIDSEGSVDAVCDIIAITVVSDS